MEAKITKDFELFKGYISAEEKKQIQDFVESFGENFKINWKRDISLKLIAKHKEDGLELTVSFKSKHIEDEDPNQLKLFTQDTEETAEAEEPELVDEES